jgi:DMSO/TMAO reductase YedYZ molybdopterin-dependent catalytic subunit
MSAFSKFVQAKIAAARRGTRRPRKPEDFADGRVPPGQRVVDNFPVLDLGRRPRLETKTWRLEIGGAVEQPLTLDWAAFAALPQTALSTDIHCVTHWSRLDVPWEGVRFSELIARVRPHPDARFVVLHSADDYTTNLPLEDLQRDDVLLAHRVDGRALSVEHGGPVRMMIPHRYFWKSAKWIQAIRFHTEDRPGFWETRGYHNEADPWREERYGRKP